MSQSPLACTSHSTGSLTSCAPPLVKVSQASVSHTFSCSYYPLGDGRMFRHCSKLVGSVHAFLCCCSHTGRCVSTCIVVIITCHPAATLTVAIHIYRTHPALCCAHALSSNTSLHACNSQRPLACMSRVSIPHALLPAFDTGFPTCMSPNKVAIMPCARFRPVWLQKPSSEYRNKCIS
jgi:hypothetical protein